MLKVCQKLFSLKALWCKKNEIELVSHSKVHSKQAKYSFLLNEKCVQK